MERVYRQVAQLIAAHDFEALPNLEINQPEYFNWVSQVFEAIHVAETPDSCALLWTEGIEVRRYSFRDIAEQTNQLVNFLRSKGVAQQNVIMTQMALLPLNWVSIMATIKGGFCMIPAATILGVHDIVYRFGKLMPTVVIADPENAPKIDEAEVLSGKSVRVKILAEGSREGWYTWDDIETMSRSAAAASTRS